ncbi:MAG: helix-turn-helix transcriptional regulator [Clostridia bacterium]|nr:helix-turn-helix transcriptional regulator [Clostridia bacterium]
MNLNFAENFKVLRKAKGLTQEKVAEFLGVSSQSVSRWELSICYPDLELLPPIANFFGVSVDSLLSNDMDSKKRDRKIFAEMHGRMPHDTPERIEFVKEYCKKYPESDEYAYWLVLAIRDYVAGDEQKTEAYMELLLKNVQRLLNTGYHDAVVRCMVTVCPERELPKWLEMAPYAGFSRRRCLVARADVRDDLAGFIQSRLETLETAAYQLDRRCPDSLGSEKKMEYQRSVLRTIESFGDGTGVPDGWKLFYAYKQLVLSACLFWQGREDEGWQEFEGGMEKYRYIFSLEEEWLPLGGALFSDLRVSRDWNYALDSTGERHKLFGLVNLSFANLRILEDLLTNPRWAWFNSVRETDRYQAAVAWVKEARADAC